MKKSEMLRLKIGDKVKIVAGSKSYKDYVQEMTSAVGQVCTVKELPSVVSSDVCVTLETKVSWYGGLYFSPSWLEKVEEVENKPVSIEKKEHPKAEVLRLIADGVAVEYNTGNSEWNELDTSENFSIFETFSYRKAEKKYQILCKTSVGKYYIATGIFTKEEANKFGNLIQILE